MKFQTRSGYQIASVASDLNDVNGPIEARDFRLRLANQPLAPFASILLGVPGSSAKTRKDPHTGFEFPTELCLKAKPCPGLAGLGVRAKRILGLKNINIYALGIYVDDVAAKRQLGARFKSSSEDAVAQDQKLFDDVVNSLSFEKSLCLVISYGALKRSTFIEALQERLEPRLKQADEVATLDAFKQQFDGVTFHKGTEIVFVQEGSKLITKIDGTQRGSISSLSLCRSLFDIYLGTDPVAPEAKTTLGKSLAAVFKR